jgi:hypothetical protein
VLVPATRPLLAAGQRGDLAVAAHLLQRVVEGRGLVQGQDLSLVREQDVDVMLGQIQELVAEPRNTERVRQRQRHLDAGPLGLDGGILHRLLRAAVQRTTLEIKTCDS